jgi:hypothetical protein
MRAAVAFGQKTRPCPEPEIIALRTLVINQGPRALWEIPGILYICADREPISGCPVNPYAASLS